MPNWLTNSPISLHTYTDMVHIYLSWNRTCLYICSVYIVPFNLSMQLEVLAPRKMKTKLEWKPIQNGIESTSNRLSALLAHLTVSSDQFEVKAMTLRNLIYKFPIQRQQFDFCFCFCFISVFLAVVWSARLIKKPNSMREN